MLIFLELTYCLRLYVYTQCAQEIIARVQAAFMNLATFNILFQNLFAGRGFLWNIHLKAVLLRISFSRYA